MKIETLGFNEPNCIRVMLVPRTEVLGIRLQKNATPTENLMFTMISNVLGH